MNQNRRLLLSRFVPVRMRSYRRSLRQGKLTYELVTWWRWRTRVWGQKRVAIDPQTHEPVKASD